eukprot:CAMPEP_0182486558 /NCGR_PEP_ID=MMETSP1319-20130603/47302_1 /TAXON_ID=172717 /ORGANISM="Bolidomonas pacifica, Strain RCC208" /LENGTH=200 /DNA_ID=CAMNT_0024688651 /DNA_START=70 /DNA_END=669 /DNA_ORIENTATION=+
MQLFAKPVTKKVVPSPSCSPPSSAASAAPSSTNALDGILDPSGVLLVPLTSLNSKQRRLLRRKLGRDPTPSDEDPKGGKGSTLTPPPSSTTAQNDSSLLAKPGDAAVSLSALSSRDKEKLVRKLSRPGGVGAPVVKTPKKVKDLSHLTDEERKRREEQREKGRIAREERERREKEGDAQEHRHPLNSERRRANKRRPSKG